MIIREEGELSCNIGDSKRWKIFVAA